jgi:hypothetical protein
VKVLQDQQDATIENALQPKLTSLRGELEKSMKEQVEVSLQSGSAEIKTFVNSLVEPIVDSRIATSIQNVKVEFSKIVDENVDLKLTVPATITNLKRSLGVEEPGSSVEIQAGNKRKKRETKKPHQSEIEVSIDTVWRPGRTDGP